MESASSAIHAHRTQSTLKDFPGRMAALFFTAGCNFRCGFCHNPDLFTTAKTYSWEELDAICATFRKQWVSAATITGGEPTLHASLPETIRFMKKRGFAIKLDTNGSNPEMLEEVIADLNYVAMDIKNSSRFLCLLRLTQEMLKFYYSLQNDLYSSMKNVKYG